MDPKEVEDMPLFPLAIMKDLIFNQEITEILKSLGLQRVARAWEN